MEELYYTAETAVVCAIVLGAIGLIIYLGWRQYRTAKRRRDYYRLKGRRAHRRAAHAHDTVPPPPPESTG